MTKLLKLETLSHSLSVCIKINRPVTLCFVHIFRCEFVHCWYIHAEQISNLAMESFVCEDKHGGRAFGFVWRVNTTHKWNIAYIYIHIFVVDWHNDGWQMCWYTYSESCRAYNTYIHLYALWKWKPPTSMVTIEHTRNRFERWKPTTHCILSH